MRADPKKNSVAGKKPIPSHTHPPPPPCGGNPRVGGLARGEETGAYLRAAEKTSAVRPSAPRP